LVIEDDSNLVAAHDPEEFEGILMEATVTAEGIRERKVFSGYEALQTLRDRCEVRDIPFELLTIASDPENAGERDQFGLTDKQYEAISVAFDRGYYDSPRTFSTDDVADELGVSGAAASDLLRRAERQLIGETVGPEQYLARVST
jgi:predicted DNA binding protein